MNIKQTYTLHNKFEIEVKDAATGELKQKAYAYNVITDIYFKMRLTGSYGGVNNSINYIGVGTGDGEPSITDTALFTAKAFYSATLVETVYAYPTSYMTRRIKIPADEQNDSVFTEVGLACEFAQGYGYAKAIVTHAMIQDAEGNKIAIKKTDVDVVYITATFYCTFTPAGFGDNGIYPRPEENKLIQWLFGLGSIDYTVAMGRNQLEYSSDLTTNFLVNKSNKVSGKGSFEDLSYEFPVLTILDTEFNDHVVKNIGIPGVGAFQFPDPSAFPDYEVNHLVLGEGDGETIEFNLKCPIIKRGSMRVFVADEELIEGRDFECDYESNCTDSRENYYTVNMNCQMDEVEFGDFKSQPPYTSGSYHDPLYWGVYPMQTGIYPRNCVVSSEHPIWIDLGEAKDCNRVRMDIPKISNTYVDKLVIEHSSDNESWQSIEYTRNEEAYSSSVTFYSFEFPFVTDRYWRVYIPDYNWTISMLSSGYGNRVTSKPAALFFIGKTVPGLKLMKAPQKGETVEVSYKLDMPYKTSNNLMRLTCTVLLQRG